VTDSQPPDESKQKAKGSDTVVAQPPAPSPQQPHAPTNTSNANGNPTQPQPFLVQLVDGVDGDELKPLKPFEEQTLAIARETLIISKKTYWVAVFGFLTALAAACFVGVQVAEMTDQTQILASQSEGANAGALMDEMSTRKQLAIAQKQADAAQKQSQAAQDSVKAIQRETRIDKRPWLRFEIGGQVISDKNPNDVIKSFTLTVGEVPNIPVRFFNFGKTPAEHVQGVVIVEIVPMGKEPNLLHKGKKYNFISSGPVHKKTDAIVRAAIPTEASTIYPDHYSEIPAKRVHVTPDGAVEDFPLTMEEGLSLKKNESYISFYGQVVYYDIFGFKHWTKFCQSRLPNGASTESLKCTEYGRVDSN